jgi:DNA-binding transcriptional MerR regulator
MEQVELYEAGAAAERLGVSPSGLRRYASLYEQVHGELPRKVNTKNRLYPGEALERLAAAKQLVEAERYKSILEALEALEQGVQPDLPATEVQVVGGLQGDTALALLDELRAVRLELVEMRAEMQTLAALPPADKGAGAEAGLLVRLAARLEQWLKDIR